MVAWHDMPQGHLRLTSAVARILTFNVESPAENNANCTNPNQSSEIHIKQIYVNVQEYLKLLSWVIHKAMPLYLIKAYRLGCVD